MKNISISSTWPSPASVDHTEVSSPVTQQESDDRQDVQYLPISEEAKAQKISEQKMEGALRQAALLQQTPASNKSENKNLSESKEQNSGADNLIGGLIGSNQNEIAGVINGDSVARNSIGGLLGNGNGNSGGGNLIGGLLGSGNGNSGLIGGLLGSPNGNTGGNLLGGLLGSPNGNSGAGNLVGGLLGSGNGDSSLIDGLLGSPNGNTGGNLIGGILGSVNGGTGVGNLNGVLFRSPDENDKNIEKQNSVDGSVEADQDKSNPAKD